MTIILDPVFEDLNLIQIPNPKFQVRRILLNTFERPSNASPSWRSRPARLLDQAGPPSGGGAD